MDADLHLGERFDVLLDDELFVSDLQEITREGKLVLSFPTALNKTAHIQTGTTVTLIYYRNNGMLAFTALCTRRFSQNDNLFLETEIRSPVTKYQRRDFVRFPAVVPVALVTVATAGEFRSHTIEDTMRLLFDRRFLGVPRPNGAENAVIGSTVDISGGGLQVACDDRFDVDSILECTFSLGEDHLTVDAQVLRADEIQTDNLGKIRLALKYIGIEERVRRRITRYIFDEQRRLRLKERLLR